jgi:Legionella pneumophila major outer membrane protein precursor
VFRSASRTLLIAILPVASLWGTPEECFDFRRDYFEPLVGVYSSGDYYVQGELLYWTHSDCDYGYAIEIDDIIEVPFFPEDPPAIRFNADRGKQEFVRPGYNPGVRMHVGMRLGGCYQQDLSYTWVEIRSGAATKLDVDNPFQPYEFSVILSNSFDGQPNKITGEVVSRYQRLNLTLMNTFQAGKWGEFLAGGEYMWVDIAHNRNTSAHLPFLQPDPATVSAKQKITFSGGGVGYMIGFNYRLGECGLRATGKSALIGLMGRQRSTRSGISSLPGSDGTVAFFEEVTVPGRSCLVPGFEAVLGLGYIHEGKCFNVRVDLTYEITHFIGPLSYRIGGAGLLRTLPEDVLFGSISYGGPSLSLEVGY